MQQETQQPKTTKSKKLSYIFTTANTLLVIVSLLLVLYSFFLADSVFSPKLNSYFHEKILSSIKENFQTPDDWKNGKWCDTLLEKDEHIGCWLYYEKVKETHFFLNQNAVELLAKGETVPDDMVFLFKGKMGWNQVGGIEDIAFEDNHRGGFVALANGDIKSVLNNQKDCVRWSLNQPKSEYKLNPLPINVSIAFSVATLFLTLYFFRRCLKTAIYSLIIGLLTGYLGGALLASLAKMFLYYSDLDTESITLHEPIICASLAMICALIIAKIKNTESLSQSKYSISIFTGIILGMFSGAAVHLTYIYSLNEIAFDSMVAGIGYGGFAGFSITIAMYPTVLKTRK